MTDNAKSKIDQKMDKFVTWYESNLKVFYASIYLGIIVFFIALLNEVKLIEYTFLKFLTVVVASIISFCLIKIYIEINEKVLGRKDKYFEIWIIPYLGFMYYTLTLTKPEIYNYLLNPTHVDSESYSSIINEMSFALAIHTLVVFFILPLLVYLLIDAIVSMYIYEKYKEKKQYIFILIKAILLVCFINTNNLASSKDSIFYKDYASWFLHLGFQNHAICDGKIIKSLKIHKLLDDKYILANGSSGTYTFEVKNCAELIDISEQNEFIKENKVKTQNTIGEGMPGIEIILQKEVVDSLVYALKQENSWYEAPAFIATISGLLTLVAATYTNKINSKENYKLKELESQLKVQESVLGIKLEALKSLTSITRELTPTIWPDPSFDSFEAYSVVFAGMDNLRKTLDDYLNSYNFILSDDVIKQVDDVMYICNLHQDNGVNSGHDHEITKAEEKAAQKVLESLDKAILIFKTELKISAA